MKKLLIAISALAISVQTASSRDFIRVVGSSTVYPFVTKAAEEFGLKNDFKTPVVESTGTGGGFKLFCSGTGVDSPDVANASRAIKKTEILDCQKNEVGPVLEVKLGYDGIVVANQSGSYEFDLSKADLFNALAHHVVRDGKLIANPNIKWSDVRADLPETEIRVYGPPPTSGTRDAFVELVMEAPCVGDAVFKAAYPDKKTRKSICHAIREDGKYIEAGESDNMIIRKLQNDEDALGIFGFSFLEQNEGIVQGSLISGVAPDFENIASGEYSISRPLYSYVKQSHFGKIAGLAQFAEEMVSDDAIGEDGYMGEIGLIPMPEDELAKLQGDIAAALPGVK